MIIARAPLRISLGGGGTDLPSYYREHGGFLIAAAIDKYVYITLHETFVDYLIVKYSETEKVDAAEELKHPLIREALKLTGTEVRGLEIASMSDIPAGSGLGLLRKFHHRSALRFICPQTRDCLQAGIGGNGLLH